MPADGPSKRRSRTRSRTAGSARPASASPKRCGAPSRSASSSAASRSAGTPPPGPTQTTSKRQANSPLVPGPGPTVHPRHARQALAGSPADPDRLYASRQRPVRPGQPAFRRRRASWAPVGNEFAYQGAPARTRGSRRSTGRRADAPLRQRDGRGAGHHRAGVWPGAWDRLLGRGRRGPSHAAARRSRVRTSRRTGGRGRPAESREQALLGQLGLLRPGGLLVSESDLGINFVLVVGVVAQGCTHKLLIQAKGCRPPPAPPPCLARPPLSSP